MRVIDAESIIEPFAAAISRALVEVEADACALIERAAAAEVNAYARDSLEVILQNNRLAAQTASPACQDTGLAVVFADIGADLHINGDLDAAVQSAVRLAYRPMRKSVLSPLARVNTDDNTPAVLHLNLVAGDRLTLSFLAKGAGSENMSALKMLTPADGVDGIVDFVVSVVRTAGGKPCPPLVVGVGIGGTMEKAALLSKRVLLRPSGTPHPEPQVAELEARILSAVNALGIGAQGLGGSTTALAVHADTYPTHIGMLPVAVNLQCHSVRHLSIVI